MNSETQILIVEDEAIIAHDISLTLEKAGYSICGVAHTADEAIKIIKKTPPALALLDIQINGPIDGLMLASIIKDQYKFPFIFLTSFTDDATLAKVKDLRAAGYIVKPFDDKELCINVELAIERHKEEKTEPTDWSGSSGDFFFIKRDHDLLKIQTKDILFAQAFDNYCYLLTPKQKHLVPHTLKSVEEKLKHHDFLRVHRSFLINLNAIDIIAEDYVEIQKTQIPISRQSKPDLMKRISLL